MQALVVPSKFRLAEHHSSARKRFSLAGGEGRGVVEVHSVEVEAGELGMFGESLDEVIGGVSREGLFTRSQLSFQEASVDQYGVASRTHDEEDRARRSAATARGAEALLDCSARRGWF